MIKRAYACFLMLIIIIMLLSSSVFARIFDDKGYYDYEGSIGQNNKIALSVYYEKDKVIGSYFYDKYRKEIKIDGKIDGDKVIFSEYDNFHNVTGTFIGIQKQDDSIVGIWEDKRNNKKLDFRLQLVSALPFTEYGHRYSFANIGSDRDTERYVEQLQNYIRKDEKVKISNLLNYPIKVKVNNKLTRINGKREFINNYSRIFTPEFKKIMENAYTKYMFVNYQGLMFGSNMKNIWINSKVITSINN